MRNFWTKIWDTFKKRKKLSLFSLGFCFSILLVTFFLNSPLFKNEPAQVVAPYTKNLIIGTQPVKNQSNEDLFLQPLVFQREHPDPGLIQNNSLVGFSSPLSVSSQILAMKTETELEVSGDKEIKEYIVKEGDSLWQISDKFGISLNTILWANDLNQNSIIKSGQKLIILPVSGTMHLVKNGDTLNQIAKTYKGEVEEIIAFNDLLEDGKIYIGDLLVIPGGQMPVSPQIFSVPLGSSYFIFPCKGKVSQGLHWYNAIDIANDCGSPIYAVAVGEIQRTGWDGIGGNFIRILHPNGVVTYYGHLSKILVEVGEDVSQGAMIGYMGQTGRTTGCHLHFDVRGAQNPLIKYSVGSYLSWK